MKIFQLGIINYKFELGGKIFLYFNKYKDRIEIQT